MPSETVPIISAKPDTWQSQLVHVNLLRWHNTSFRIGCKLPCWTGTWEYLARAPPLRQARFARRTLHEPNSLTKTMNWSGINEVTETSCRLHPLWPQNNWLHTPRTTDYRHIRQDRWIQTELAFTLAKNATKPKSLWNLTNTDHKVGELEDRRSVGTSSCNSGDGTDQRVESLIFMMMILQEPKPSPLWPDSN